MLVLLLGRHLGSTVAGPVTWGMVLLGAHVLTALTPAVRFERHHADRDRTDGQHGAPAFQEGSGQQ
ncbi:hypothetical protein ACFVZZ_18305 [Streptomyces chartreusis]|uniref:hypothetical protein n=1 Tax=Streptomyces chartreusis TaxID=1969 RepID=UPI0036D83263